jgi:hypothetical protein
MHVCFLVAQDIISLSSEKIHPDVDLLSLELVIQLTSQYPFITAGKSE